MHHLQPGRRREGGALPQGFVALGPSPPPHPITGTPGSSAATPHQSLVGITNGKINRQLEPAPALGSWGGGAGDRASPPHPPPQVLCCFIEKHEG